MAKSNIVAEAFTLTNKDGSKTAFKVGDEVTAEQAKHWFVQVHLMDKAEPKAKKDAEAEAKAKAEAEAAEKAAAEAAAAEAEAAKQQGDK